MTCPECGEELDVFETDSAWPFITGSRMRYPRYECPKCGYEHDTFYDAVDAAYDRAYDR